MINTTPCGCGKSSPKSEKCKCGCQGGGHADCCDLECLERPRFFCGQLLTDQDFNKLTEWIDRKNALQRFLHGWGVVCGLDITIDPCDCATISVGPGYAIDCCGRDLVVCEPLPLSLQSQFCSDAEDPCGSLGSATASSSAAARTTPATTQDFGGLKVPTDEIVTIDLFLRYGEQISRPQRQAVSGKCSSTTDPCQFTRVSEVPELCAKLAPPDPVKALVPYGIKLAALIDALNHNTRNADDFNRYLASAAYNRAFGGIHRFSFIPQLSRNMDWNQALFAYWIVQDWYLSYSAPCVECEDSSAVTVARVYLRKYVEAGVKKCCIIYVEQAPPYRRPIGKQQVPAGATSLVPYLWQPLDQPTRAALMRLDVEVREFDPATLGTLGAVQSEFERATYWTMPESKSTAGVITFQGEQRIAFFQRTA